MRTQSRFVGAALLLLAWAAPAAAQMRAIVPIPYNESPTTQVSVKLDPVDPRIGGLVSVCFAASKAGFVTLWNIATNGSVVRIFPNSFQQAGARDQAAMKIEPTARSCVGASGDNFRFRVDGPAGTEDLYLLWTARSDLQPPGGAFADAQSFASALKRLGDVDQKDWAVAKTTYDISPPSGPQPAPLPPQQGSGTVGPASPAPSPSPGQSAQAPAPAPAGRVVVLAMGANVDKLTKSNQDATMFIASIRDAFQVAPQDARLISNATKSDFRDGMEWLRGRTGPNDLVFLYFSGHGAQVDDPTHTSEDDKDELLIPYDFQTKPRPSLKDGVFSQELARWINALPTSNVISVLDTCHSGGLYRSIEGDVLGANKKVYALPADMDMTRPDGLNPPRTRAAGGSGRVQAHGLLLAAARRDQSALEGPQGSYFTLALVQALRSSSSGTFADTFDRAAADTRSVTRNRQNPVTVGDLATARLISFSP